MAGEAGQPSEPLNLLAGMAAAPWDYDFFQALRRIECESPQLPRLGHSVRLADDPLRLGQKPDCTFAPSTLASVSQAGTAAVPRLDQFFFGLTGPNGPLPLHLTEYARERQRNVNDATFKRFMDVFHHRLLTLFYRAWAEARPEISHDRIDDDYWSARLAALSGRGMPSLRGREPLADTARYYYTGHLAAQTRYPDGLRVILAEYFEVPVAVEEYVGQWLELPERSRLGVDSTSLGMDVCLGTHVWDRQHKFRLRLGPLDLDQYQRFLPDATTSSSWPPGSPNTWRGAGLGRQPGPATPRSTPAGPAGRRAARFQHLAGRSRPGRQGSTAGPPVRHCAAARAQGEGT